MAHYRRYTCYFLIGTFILISGCSSIKEDWPNCDQLTLTLKVLIAEDESDIGLTKVDSAQVYLFGGNGYIASMGIGNLPNGYTFKLDKTDEIAIAAWGNLKNDSLEVPSIYTGMRPDQVLLKLKKSGEYCQEPLDLFFASYRSDNPVTGSTMQTSLLNAIDKIT